METEKRKSRFIKILSWFLIVINGLGVLAGTAQIFLMQGVMGDPNFKNAMNDMNGSHAMPPLAGTLFEHFNLLMIGQLLLSLLAFIAAIALLKRKNWARLFFIVLFIGGIVWSLVGVYMQYDVMTNMNIAGSDIPAGMEATQTKMMFISGAITLLVIALYAYIIKRLRSEEIKSEFIEA